MGVEIREPLLADAEAVGRMHYASWREAYAPLLPDTFWGPEAEAERIAMWTRSLAAPSREVTTRIAVEEGVVIGHAVAGPAGMNEAPVPPARDRQLWSLYVLAAEYGTGLASRLLAAVLPEGPAELWVFEANPRARAFYEQHGFRADGARHVFGPDLGNQPEIRMVR